jgi:hypothetical protein
MPSKSPNAKSTKRKTPSHDEIRLRAYEISQSGGSRDDVANWLDAERELVDAAAPKPRRRKTVAA